jgi:methyl-accepting chemotaxis protein
MQNITVRFSLMASLCLFAAMILAGAGVGLYSLDKSNQSTALVHRLAAQTQAINDAYKDTTRARSALTRAYSALKESQDQEGKKEALAKAQTNYERSLKTLEEFNKLAPVDGGDPVLKTGLYDAGQRLGASLAKATAALRSDDTDAYVAVNNKDLTADGAAFSALLEKFQKQNTEQGNAVMAESELTYKRVCEMVMLGLTIALAVVVATHVMLKRLVIAPLDRAVGLLDQVAHGDLTMQITDSGRNEISRLLSAIRRMQEGLVTTVAQVRNGADTINTGAQEIAAGNMDLSSRTESQASSLEETAASMEELTSTVKQNAENARQASALVQAASNTATKGGAVMGEMVETMSAINESSRKIVDIISVIDGIAFQTNILALNAAVEAARAGEQGRGFAVVATEVRNLAQRSAGAAKEIKGLINDSVEKVDSGSRLVEHAGMTMSEVVDSVQRVTDIVSEIAEASREQSHGIEQVNQAIAQMDEVTQRNAALVEEAAAATQSLQSQANTLTETVSVFKLSATHAAPAAFASRPVLPAAVPSKLAAKPARAPAALRHAPQAQSPAKPAPRREPVSNDSSDWEEF